MPGAPALRPALDYSQASGNSCARSNYPARRLGASSELTETDGTVDTCGPTFENECACCGAYVELKDVSTWVGEASCASSVFARSLTIRDSIVGGVGGLYLDMSMVEVRGGVQIQSESVIRHSVMHGPVQLTYWARAARLSHSQVDGEVEPTGEGQFSCFSVHDADLNPLEENCQPTP